MGLQREDGDMHPRGAAGNSDRLDVYDAVAAFIALGVEITLPSKQRIERAINFCDHGDGYVEERTYALIIYKLQVALFDALGQEGAVAFLKDHDVLLTHSGLLRFARGIWGRQRISDVPVPGSDTARNENSGVAPPSGKAELTPFVPVEVTTIPKRMRSKLEPKKW